MANYLTLPKNFQKAYIDREIYPRNLILRTVSTYPSALAAFATRLDNAAETLFETDLEKVEVSIRDLKTNNGGSMGKDMDKCNVHTPEKLTKWLGIKVMQDPNDPNQPIICGQSQDPKCRFIYIYGKNSRAKLKITRSMLVEILTFHQVMPDYLDFMFVFGLQSEPRDLRYSSFREQITLKKHYTDHGIDSLVRSGRQYQLCWNLKGVTLKDTDSADPALDEYSIRQAAFYHRFDVVTGNTLWIVTKGGTDIQQRFKELTGTDARPEDKAFDSVAECFRSSLSAQLLFCHWSREDWRGYLRWLEYTTDQQTKMAVLGPSGKGYHHHKYTARDIQRLQTWEERASDVINILESNVEVMKSLKRFYTNLCGNADFPLQVDCGDDIEIFANQVSNIIDDLRLQIGRAQALVKIIFDRTELVKQHRLERLNLNLEREAIVVRIITLVTLVYLPATFVSTFFSTDIIKYQGQPPGGSYSTIAMNRWLQVTLPLTFITLVVAYVAWRLAEAKSRLRVLPMDAADEDREWWFSALLPAWGKLRRTGSPRSGTSNPPVPLLPLHKQQTLQSPP